MTTYIGIDPGGTTGLVRYDPMNNLLEALDLKGAESFLVGLHVRGWLRESNRNCVVVCEQSLAYGVKIASPLLRNVRIEGAVEFLCYDIGIRLVFQGPSVRKEFQPLANLRLTGKKVHHARDAYAHVLAYLKERPTKEETEILKNLKL